jgi:hypothetical protein
MDPSMRESLEEVRQTWLAESDEALFQALTVGRAKYTDAALSVIADEAARRGLTRAERMKQLAAVLKGEPPMVSPDPDEPDIGLSGFPALLVRTIGVLLVFGGMIALRIFIRRLF